MSRPLSEACTCYTRARIVAVHLPREERRRILEMGFVPGTIVEFVRFAPWSESVVLFRLRNYSIALRAELIAQIDVDLLP